MFSRVSVRKFPPRLSTLSLPKIKLGKPRPSGLKGYKYKAPAKPSQPSSPGGAVKGVKGVQGSQFDVMLSPGTEFQLVTNTEEEAEPHLVVDLSGDTDTDTVKTVSGVSGVSSLPSVSSVSTLSTTREPEIIYGSPDVDQFRVSPDVAPATLYSAPPPAAHQPTYRPGNTPAPELEEGFMPSKYLPTQTPSTAVTSPAEVEVVTVREEPVIQSTYEQQPPAPSLTSAQPFTPRPHHAPRPRPVLPQPLDLPQFQFQEVRSLANLRGPPPFAPHFEDVTPDFRSLFPRQFAREGEAEFEGFPLARVHPASVISNIATFTSDTDLVDSEC